MDTVIASPSIASSNSARWLALAAAALATGASAVAQIELYTARVTQSFQQTSDAGPVSSGYRFDAQLRTVNVGDGDWVTLIGSNSSDGIINMTVNGRTWSHTSATYASMAALKADYPIPNTYFMEIGGGIFVEPKQVAVVLDENNFPDAVPMLTGSTFSGLNNWNPTSGDFLMTFNSHSDLGLGDPNYVKTYVTFYDQTTGDGNPISWLLDNSATSLLLDGSLFAAGHQYYGYLQFFHQYSDADHENFGSINGLTTSFSFTTSSSEQTPGDVSAVPEPSTYGLIAAASLCGLVALRRRRKQTAQN